MLIQPQVSGANGINQKKHSMNKERPRTTTLKTRKELSICESLPRLDLVSFPVLSQIKLQTPLLEVPFR